MVIVGIDEVGRGCWAGPVVAGAVILKSSISKLTDSKLLSKSQRQLIAKAIYQDAVYVGLGWVAASEVDDLGLTKSVKLAMTRALEQLDIAYDEIIIDGKYNFLPENPRARTIIKADMTIPAVSAASIVAKVARDKYMQDISKEFPDYGFDQHVGYGTALHIEKLSLHGVCRLHRLSYKPIKALTIVPA